MLFGSTAFQHVEKYKNENGPVDEKKRRYLFISDELITVMVYTEYICEL